MSRAQDAQVAETIMGWRWATTLRVSYLLPPPRRMVEDDPKTVYDPCHELGVTEKGGWRGWCWGKHGEEDLEWAHLPTYATRYAIPQYSGEACLEVLPQMKSLGFVWNLDPLHVTFVHIKHRDEHGRGKVHGYARIAGEPFRRALGSAICDAAICAVQKLRAREAA